MAIKAQASQTLVDLTDGFSVSLSQDSASWNGGASNLGTQQTVAVVVSAYQGSSVASSFSIGTCVCSDSTNCSASVSGTTVNITVAAAATAGGTVTIPVNITANGSQVTINKTFSYSIALRGQQGGTGATGVSMRNKGEWASGTAYTAGTSGGTYIDIVTLDGSSYMCKTSHTASNSNKPPNSTYWTLVAEQGEQGPQGIQGIQGIQGEEGDPAIVLSITADTTVLKNNSGSATLTAHVYVGGDEATIASSGTDNGKVTYNSTVIGTVKWYEGSSSTGTASKTHTVSAANITNTMTVYAKLEA